MMLLTFTCALRTEERMSLLLIIGCAATTGEAETEAPVTVDADLAEIGAYQGYDGAGEPMESGQSGTVIVAR